MDLGFSDVGIPYGLRHKKEIKMLKEMISLMKSGIKKLKSVKNKNKELSQVINMCEYITCCTVTVLNVKYFYEQKIAIKLCESPKKMQEICAKIRKIANDEIANAEKSIKYLRKDSSLGWEASMGYVGGEERVLWKIKQVNYMLNRELGYYEKEVEKHLERIK
jgi:superfamily II DNA helicase RecQ